jgi:CHAT domain-containing protein
MAALSASSFLSFSGHATYAGADGWDSALLLAGGERLGVADILALQQAPSLVVLSGCETGREGEHGGPGGLGLSDAFIASGARAVVASNRRVRDDDGERMMRALGPALAAHPADAAQALREAQTTILREAPTVDWSAYRVLVP